MATGVLRVEEITRQMIDKCHATCIFRLNTKGSLCTRRDYCRDGQFFFTVAEFPLYAEGLLVPNSTKCDFYIAPSVYGGITGVEQYEMQFL